MIFQEQKNSYTISTDYSKIDISAVHEYLCNHSYWAGGIPYETVKRSIENAVCFGVYDDATGKLVGFARVITDKATIAYIGDVYVLEEHRGKGLSKWLMECIMKHPELQGFRRWILLTKDAHGLYKQYGFNELEDVSIYMELRNKDVYKK